MMVEYFPETSIVSKKTETVNGIIQGYVQIFNSNGKLARSSKYNNGVQHGDDTLYNDGEPVETFLWDNGTNLGNKFEVLSARDQIDIFDDTSFNEEEFDSFVEYDTKKISTVV